jgi:acyl-CoA synthetase (AMP-forming)/AMP-acid ligase II
MPDVSDLAVVGVPHPFWGECIVVCIEAGPGVDEAALATAVRERCEARLSKASQPDRVAFLPAFPRTTTGKVQRRVLQQELAD